MRALLTREFIVMARRPTVPFALALHVTMMMMFVLVWSGGVPVFPGATLFDQQQTVQVLMLLALLPWTAARVALSERGAQLALCGVVTARRPSTVVVARLTATAGVLGLIAVAALPASVLAQQLSGVPLIRVLRGLPTLAALTLLTAAVASASALVVPGRLAAWAAGAVVTAGLFSAFWRVAGLSRGGAMTLFAGLLLAVLAGAYADRTCLHAHA